MIRHAMEYVHRAEKVMAEMGPGLPPESQRLARAKHGLVKAEGALVRAYGIWREGMTLAAERGNELVARYLRESEWDLT